MRGRLADCRGPSIPSPLNLACVVNLARAPHGDLQRQRRFDCSPFHWLRMDLELTAQRSQPFFHAPDPDAVSRGALVHVKTLPLVGNGQVQLLPDPLQANLGSSGATVTLDVSESFLKHTKEAKREICRNSRRHILVHKVHLHCLLISEFLAEGLRSRH